MIIFANGTQVNHGTIFAGPVYVRGAQRETIRIEIAEGYTHEQLVALFTDGAVWELETQAAGIDPETGNPRVDENGAPIMDIQRFDKSTYSIGGNIVDKRDGTFEVMMSQPTALEQAETENAALLLEMGGIA